MSENHIPSDDEMVDFVYHEARLLDEKRYEEWRALFTEDGVYWVPLEHDQPDPVNHTSLIYDDQLLMQVRIRRMESPRAFSLRPRVYAHHLLAQPRVESRDPDANTYVMRTDFHYTEAKGDDMLQLAATAYHELTAANGRLQIQRKRVNLLNCDASHPAIHLYP